MKVLSRIVSAARRRLAAPSVVAPPDAQTIDLDEAAVAANPFPHYDRLRAAGSVQFLPRHGFWIILDHDDARRALGEAETFSNAPYAGIDAVLLAADPPVQAAIRRLLSRRFASSNLGRLEARAREVAGALLQPEIDAVGGYARPISRAVAAELIGFDAAAVAEISEGSLRALAAPEPLAELIAVLDRIAPRASIFAELGGDAGGLVGDAEIRSLVRLLWLAATTTTERVIAHAVLRLADDPDLAARIGSDRALLGPYIEEVMRLHPPEHLLPRLATMAVEIAGVTIPANALVQICVAAADRDPAHFDRPHDLLLDRPQKRHLAFGSGIHHCLGAPLSRRVVTASLDILLDAADDLRLRVPAQALPFFKTASALSPTELPIAL